VRLYHSLHLVENRSCTILINTQPYSIAGQMNAGQNDVAMASASLVMALQSDAVRDVMQQITAKVEALESKI
jgi:hypothetical protein